MIRPAALDAGWQVLRLDEVVAAARSASSTSERSFDLFESAARDLLTD
jgi:hypothetical protein